MIPFFVLDRPVSLEILKDFFAKNLDHKFGILTHAFTSRQFKGKFRNFPFDTPLKYSNLNDSQALNVTISKNIIKFVDSGIFQAKRDVSYNELFDIYDHLKADYGIIIDFLKDKDRTLESARNAIKIYNKKRYRFSLVGVAQGKTMDEYLSSFQSLLDMGYQYIAIGGLLKRNGESNYLGLRDEEFMEKLVNKIYENFGKRWLFLLGVFNPTRKSLLERLGIWGADYKGWIYQYEEDYSFIFSYIEKDPALSVLAKNYKFLDLLKKYVHLKKQNAKLIYLKTDKDRNLSKEIRYIRKAIEDILYDYGYSLQYFRFRRVRENLNSIFKGP